jgi:hypothetical protein
MIEQMPDYPPEYDGGDHCEVCYKWIGTGSRSDSCDCPECPQCSEVGNPECYKQGHIQQLHIKMVYINTLMLNKHNTRMHDTHNLDAIKQSLKQFGWRSVIVVRKSDRLILAGNGRIKAAQALGWALAPVMFVDATDIEAAKFALADNHTAELATWNKG